MSPGTVVIRTEARPEIGHGHLMRCFALAQAWKDCSGTVVFAMSQPPARLIKHPDMKSFAYFDTGGCDPDEPDRVAALAKQYDANWIVVDGYGFTTEYQRKLKNSGRKLLVIDDNGHTGEYVCDLVVDQNAGARESYYARRQPGTQLLLGSRYALLRREFCDWSHWKREAQAKARKILVTMGGGDPENLSCRAIAALCSLKRREMQTKVVAGGSNPHLVQLRQMAAECGGNFEIITDANMPELMMWADLAVSSAGSTCWELCMLGLPAVLIDAADNQIPIARELHQRGIAEYIPRHEATVGAIGTAVERLLGDKEGRGRMSTLGRRLVDARGALRVVAAMRAHGVTLRKACEEDCRVLWQWVNDPDVRKASFVHAPVVWQTHTAWFSSKLRDPNCVILIAQDELGNPIGQFRVDLRSDSEGVIDVSISAQRRKSGWGSRVIDLCSLQIISSTQVGRLHAFVRPENVASLRAFEHADFVKVGEEVVNGELAVHYERSKQQSLV